MINMWKASFYEVRFALLGWVFGFSISTLLIQNASVWFWIIEPLIGLGILFMGFLIARHNLSK